MQSEILGTIYQPFNAKEKSALRVKVGFQGSLGSFHHQAADVYFTSGNSDVIPLETLPELFNQLISGTIDYAMLAVENTVSGFIHTSYAMLQKYNANILGEVYLPVCHCLHCSKNDRLGKIEEIHLNSMDTALDATYITEESAKDIDAIARIQAAEIYNLQTLQKRIKNKPCNFIRFVCLSVDDILEYDLELLSNLKKIKATLSISIKELQDELPQLLHLFSRYGISAKVLIPVMEQQNCHLYKYWVDVISDNVKQIFEVVHLINNIDDKIEIIGIYESKS